ncbi:MAG: thiamine-phosphate pyrophosphorylase [Acidobacteriaceae bacterium]|nr:thiamine-phosphate pyrophosphorylase [Acidobacteriaceae bacterium]
MFPPSKFSGAPILCYVTDRRSLACADEDQIESLLRRIATAAAAGIDWIQIREKDFSGKELCSLTRAAVAQTKQISERGRTRFLVNDRVDVALSVNSGGVHLGEHSLPVDKVRKWVASKPGLTERDKFLVGVSCHSVQSATEAERNGADYIFFGPVFATPSKVAFGVPQGLQRLGEVCSAVAIPVLAIGGITRDNASDCMAAGAAGIAAIRLFQDAENLARLVSELRASFL